MRHGRRAVGTGGGRGAALGGHVSRNNSRSNDHYRGNKHKKPQARLTGGSPASVDGAGVPCMKGDGGGQAVNRAFRRR